MARLFLFAAVTALTFSYYNWLARSSGNEYVWEHDLHGYYNYLGRAFVQGQLHLPLEPPKELLALTDPWDPAVNKAWRLQDGVLYKGRYYLYHGAGPAVVLFAPWRIVTGHDLPEGFALVLLCLASYLFLAGSLLLLLKGSDATPSEGWFGIMLLLLAVGTGAPYLLTRIWVYEIAIAGALVGVTGGWFFLILGMQSSRPAVWFVMAGLFFGLALSSRPHVGIAGSACTLLVLASYRRWRHVALLAAPVVLTGIAVLAYNYARFDNPLEFGTHFQLADARNQQRLNPSVENLYPGIYYMLVCPPFVGPVFPFVRLFTRIPVVTESLPVDYFFEPTTGALLISPVLFGLLLLPLRRIPAGIVLTSLGAFLFVITIGLTTQRYQIDFVPLALLAALVGTGITMRRWQGWRRGLLIALFALTSIWTVFANAALAMTGPYDEILQRKPRTWLRIASWFPVAERHRPLLNPRVSIAMRISAQEYGPGLREPLVVLGHQALRWVLYLDHTDQGMFLVSEADTGTHRSEAALTPDTNIEIAVEYDPQSRTMTTAIDGEQSIRHVLNGLALARSQVHLGRNDTIPFLTYPEFTGKMTPIRSLIDPLGQ